MADTFLHLGAAQSLAMDGQRVLITGAAGGIGSATARVCAALGAHLLLADREPPAALAHELRAARSKPVALGFDVADRVASEQAIAAHGVPDALVLNAGYCPWDDWLDAGWDAVFDQVIDVNLHGVIHLVRAALPGMVARGSGRIVIVSSVAGRMGGLRASPHYVAAKGGIGALVKWFARRAARHGVCVNAVAPGATATTMTEGQAFDANAIPMGRLASPEEVALPIAFLCSPAASYICGTTLDVNGGVHMA